MDVLHSALRPASTIPTLRVKARGLAKLDVLGSLVAQAAAETATPADADDWVSVTIPIESVERAASGLIALGADAVVDI